LGVRVDWRIVSLRLVPETVSDNEDHEADDSGAKNAEAEGEEEEYSEWVLYKNSTASRPYKIQFEELIEPEVLTEHGDEVAHVANDDDAASEASDGSSSYAISSATDPDSDGPKKDLAPRYGHWTLIYNSCRMRDQLLLNDLVQRVEPHKVVTEVDNLGRSPIILAALNHRGRLSGRELAVALLGAQAKVDHKDKAGSTALMYAAALGDMGTVEVLLEGSADANELNSERKSAFDLAKNSAMRKLLARKMVERRIKPSKASAGLAEALEAVEQCKAEEKAARSQNFVVRIEGLPHGGEMEAAERVLHDLLRKKGAGRPKRVEVVADPITKLPTGLAYVDYHLVKLAEAVMAADGELVEGSVVRVFREIPLDCSNYGTGN
jgi:hypothetical protein